MEAIKLLKSHNVAITDARLDLISELLSAKAPMSCEDFRVSMNKTSFYRNMELFIQANLVKKIELDGRGYYVLSESACAVFVCESCHRTQQVDMPVLSVHANSVLIKGLCDSCDEIKDN